MPCASVVDMETILAYCQSNEWRRVKDCVAERPELALTILKMKNKLTTTILHQAISSRGHLSARAEAIMTILKVQPRAASIANGYNSLPLHVIAQRNTSLDSPTKERLIMALIKSYPEALEKQGGLRERTPLHIAFTDYISPRIIKLMLELGPGAASICDKEGWLPIHVACSRHCSPEKLSFLLVANPGSLESRTNQGQTPLSLARSTATKAHPNLLLLQDLKNRLNGASLMTSSPRPSTQVSIEITPINSRSKRKKASKRRTVPSPNEHAELLLHFHKNVAERPNSSVSLFSTEKYDGSDALLNATPYAV